MLRFTPDSAPDYGGGIHIKVRTYREAVDHVEFTCGRRRDRRTIIRALARGKGLEERVNARRAAAFFDGSPGEPPPSFARW